MKSISKIRHIQESNRILENRLLNEQATSAQTATLNPTYDNPLCNNMTGSYGSGSETSFKACVYKIGPSFAIDLRDGSTVLFSDGGSNFAEAYQAYVSQSKKLYPDKMIGRDLPIPIDPSNESASKFYKLGK